MKSLGVKIKSIGAVGHDLFQNSWMSAVSCRLECFLHVTGVTVVLWGVWMVVFFCNSSSNSKLSWCEPVALEEFDPTSTPVIATTWLCWTHWKSRGPWKWVELCWDVSLLVLSCTHFSVCTRRAAECPLHPDWSKLGLLVVTRVRACQERLIFRCDTRD